jgi:hypothetical protein
MKIYSKNIDGNLVIKPSNEIVIHKNGKKIYHPTSATIIDDGWEEYRVNKSDIKKCKDDIIRKIKTYDTSSEINTVFISGTPTWFNKSTRVGLRIRFESEIQKGFTQTTLWYNGIPCVITLEEAMKMLHEIELYASACYDNTQQHIYNVNQLENLEDVNNYNYKVGYPEKLNFQYN